MRVRRVVMWGRAFLCGLVVLGVDVRPARAQSEAAVRGRVVAAADAVPIGNLAVTLTPQTTGSPLQARTDADGRFVFGGVRPDEYVLSAAAEGFARRDVRLVLKPRDVQSITVALDVAPLAVDVEVAAESVPSTHSPSSTMLLAQRLDEMPLARRTSLPDAIVSAAPGMVRGHDDFVHIRGHEVALNPSINGVQFWENAHAVFSPGLGVDYIESINVMTGGFPAEYGNRFGGVLDVVTKSGLTMRNSGSVAAGAGTAGRHNLAGELGGQRGRAGYYLNLSGFRSDRLLSPPSPRSIHNSGTGLRTFGRLDVRAGDRHHVSLVATGDGVDFDLPMDERDEVLRPDFRHAQRTRSQSLILSWSHTRSAETVLQTSFYQRWSRVHQFPEAVDPFGAVTDAERSLATFGVKSDLTRFLGRHTFKGGADLVVLRPREELSYLSQPWIDFTHRPDVNEAHVHLRGPNLGPGVPRPLIFSGEETGGQASLFLQDTMQLTSGLTVDLGLRFDRYSLAISESHVSPRVNAAFRLPAGTVLFASYNHFFVPPPIENVLAGSAGLTGFLSEIGRPLPPLRAVKEDQFEAGLTQPLFGIGSVGVTGYYRASDDPLHTSLFPDSRFYTYATFERGTAYGAEVKASVTRLGASGLSGYMNYAFGRVWFYNPIEAGFTTEAAHLTEVSRFLAPMDQAHTITSGVTYRHARTGLWAGAAMEYGSGTPGGHGSGDHAHDAGVEHEHATGAGLCAARCPSHLTGDVSLGWSQAGGARRPRLAVQLTVENVSNRVYLLSKESTMVQGQYSIPRLVSASIRVRF
jgi:outer membrane receptor protein involved in Fe transport